MKQHRSAEELMAATMRKSHQTETEAMRTNTRDDVLDALAAAKRQDPADETQREPAGSGASRSDQAGNTGPGKSRPKAGRSRNDKRAPSPPASMSFADEHLHKTSVSFTQFHLQKLLDLEYHYRRQGLPGLSTNKLVMAAIAAAEIGPELDEAVRSVIASDKRTGRAAETPHD
jgi:hypothetical protein